MSSDKSNASICAEAVTSISFCASSGHKVPACGLYCDEMLGRCPKLSSYLLVMGQNPDTCEEFSHWPFGPKLALGLDTADIKNLGLDCPAKGSITFSRCADRLASTREVPRHLSGSTPFVTWQRRCDVSGRS